jgi:hypothetical protein
MTFIICTVICISIILGIIMYPYVQPEYIIERHIQIQIQSNGTYQVILPCPVFKSNLTPIPFDYNESSNNYSILITQLNETPILLINASNSIIFESTWIDKYSNAEAQFWNGTGYIDVPISSISGKPIWPMGLTLTSIIKPSPTVFDEVVDGKKNISEVDFNNSKDASQDAELFRLESRIFGESHINVTALTSPISIKYILSEKIRSKSSAFTTLWKFKSIQSIPEEILVRWSSSFISYS